MNQIEIWKDVVGYEGIYQISNLGRVKSLKFGRERIIMAYANGRGYLLVGLLKEGLKGTRAIHQLVAESFLEHTPCGHKVVVDHIDNNKLNNNVENLQLITQRDNSSKDKKGYSSKYVGVSWNKFNQKWATRITIKGKYKHLGYFINELDASKAYKVALKSVI